MKSPFTLFLGFTTVILGAMVLYDRYRIHSLETQLNIQTIQLAQRNVTIGRKSTSVRLEGETESVNNASPTPESSPSESAEATSAQPTDILAATAAPGTVDEWMNNPAMRDRMYQDSLGRMLAEFGPFLQELKLDEEQADSIMNLLAERELFAIEKSIEIMDESAPLPRREAAGAELAETWFAYEDSLRELLGPEAFGSFQLYEEVAPERHELSSFTQSIGNDLPGLTPSQEQDLMTIMFEERQKFSFTDNYLDDDQYFDVPYTESSFQNFRAEFTQLHNRIGNRASEILSPAQLEVFSTNQENFRNSFIQQRVWEIQLLTAQ
ncbi:MAG: hypothetical protein AAGD22_17145 [Verrucomicrobiota bacterium]